MARRGQCCADHRLSHSTANVTRPVSLRPYQQVAVNCHSICTADDMQNLTPLLALSETGSYPIQHCSRAWPAVDSCLCVAYNAAAGRRPLDTSQNTHLAVVYSTSPTWTELPLCCSVSTLWRTPVFRDSCFYLERFHCRGHNLTPAATAAR